MTEDSRTDLSALLAGAASHLRAIDAAQPRLEAEYLLQQALGISRLSLLSRAADAPMDPAARARFDALLRRRLAREPLAYVLGHAEFCGLSLEVGPGALIPRPETEVLVERVRAWAAQHPPPPGACGIDVGTGTGAIALALARGLAMPWIGVDRSHAALAWAARNRGSLETAGSRDGSVSLARGDLLTAFRRRDRHPVWIVVANLPYIPDADIDGLAVDVRDHEPRLALAGGPDGLRLVRELARQAAQLLAPGGLLALELGLGQASAMQRMLETDLPFQEAEVYADLTGRDRGVLARRAARSAGEDS